MLSIRLSKREYLGIDSKRPRLTYTVTNAAPQRVQRAVALLNTYDSMAQPSKTNEDWPVARARFVTYTVYLVITLLPCLFFAHTLLAAVQIWAFVLISIGLSSLVWGEPFCDMVASRIFGVPANPRLYVRQGIKRGFVRQL
jgi:hypothetical protein